MGMGRPARRAGSMKPNGTTQDEMGCNGLGNRCSILLSYGTGRVRIKDFSAFWNFRVFDEDTMSRRICTRRIAYLAAE